MYDVIIFTDVNGAIGFGRYAGAYKVATELRKNGFSTQVIDFFGSLSLSEIKAILDKFISKKTLFVGFATTLFMNKQITLEKPHHHNIEATILPFNDNITEEIFLHIRKTNVKVVIGGSKATYMDTKFVDYFVLGEADMSIIELAKKLRSNKPIRNKISSTEYRYTAFNTSSIKWAKNDFIFPNEHLPIEISRGCIFRCAFCSYHLNGKKNTDYIKGSETLSDEFKLNYDSFGTTGYMFCDDTFNDSISKVKQMHSCMISLPFKLEWVTYARLDVIAKYPEMLDLMVESGLKSIYFGLETFHHETGKIIGKGYNPEKLKLLLYKIKNKYPNLSIVSSFIVGLPNEPISSIQRTIEWLATDDCPINHPILIPLNIKKSKHPEYGMSLFGLNPIKYGYLIDESGDWYSNIMTQKIANQIVFDGYATIKRKQSLGFSFYSMLRNLGFTIDEINSNNFTLDEINSRYTELRNQYFNNIM